MSVRYRLGIAKRRVIRWMRSPIICWRMLRRAYLLEDDRWVAERALGADYYKKFEEEFRGLEIKPSWVHYVKILQNRLDQNGTIVDIGAGAGRMLRYFQDHCPGRNYVAIEPDLASASEAWAAGLQVRQQDFLEYLISAPRKSVDVLFLSHVAEHLPWETLVACFAQLRGVLRPKGLLIIETPNCASIMTSAVNFWGDPTHIRPISPATLDFTLRRVGFYVHENIVFSPHQDSGELSGSIVFGEGQDRVLVAESTD